MRQTYSLGLQLPDLLRQAALHDEQSVLLVARQRATGVGVADRKADATLRVELHHFAVAVLREQHAAITRGHGAIGVVAGAGPDGGPGLPGLDYASDGFNGVVAVRWWRGGRCARRERRGWRRRCLAVGCDVLGIACIARRLYARPAGSGRLGQRGRAAQQCGQQADGELYGGVGVHDPPGDLLDN